MDHPVHQLCWIYQLEDVHIKGGETPDGLIECIQNLAERCDFPDDVEKECHVQFQFICALNEPELVWKLLAMKMYVTTSLMLEMC